jgi:hypothetical protein
MGELNEPEAIKPYSPQKMQIRDKLRNNPQVLMSKRKTGFEYLAR